MSLPVNHRCSTVAFISLALSFSAFPLFAQTEDSAKPEIGEIVGNDVYVRSGASLNHYPVCKLDAGTRVTIMGEHGEWLEIKPPEGTFSWISAEFVDTANDRDGVVNGDNVRVRAGSELPKWAKSKYAVQTMLRKGSEVTILDKNPDGFLKITPPADASLWVHRKFIERVSGDALAEVPEANSPIDDGSTPSGQTTHQDSASESASVQRGAANSPFAAMPMTAQRHQLEELDKEAKAEVAKPIMERTFEPLIDRYQKIVEQEDDEFASRYAQSRVTQLSQMNEMIEAVVRTRQLRTETDDQRRALLEERLKMQTVTIPAPRGLDVKGLLKASALYPEGSEVERYRLMDPAMPEGKTIAYIEVPADSDLNVTSFLGKYVGIRATGRHFQEGGVDAIPIYEVEEIVSLDSPDEPQTDDSGT